MTEPQRDLTPREREQVVAVCAALFQMGYARDRVVTVQLRLVHVTLAERRATPRS